MLLVTLRTHGPPSPGRPERGNIRGVTDTNEHDAIVLALPSAAMIVEDDGGIETLIDELVETSIEVSVDPGPLGRDAAMQQRSSGRWSVTDVPSAEWALRKLAEAEIRLDETADHYKQFRAQLDAWYARTAAPHLTAIGLFTDHLEDYGRRWIATQKKSAPKSLPLPSGIVKTSTRTAKAVIADPDVLLAWAKEHEPTLVHTETKEWVLISEVRDYVDCIVDIDKDADELITTTRVVHRITKDDVPGLIVEAEHVDVKVIVGPP